MVTKARLTDPNDPRHGTENGYVNLGCRCDGCRDAHRIYQHEYRHRRYASDGSRIPHGTLGGYKNWGCRCDECSRVTKEYRRKHRAASVARKGGGSNPLPREPVRG